MKKHTLITLACAVLSLASGCSASDDSTGAAGGAAGGAGVAQGGAQDFGGFRQILQACHWAPWRLVVTSPSSCS